MNMWKIKWNSGFTLMELIITILILALIVSLAFPTYTQYVRKSRRGEAQKLLMNWSINQEIWRSNNPSYAGDDSLLLPKPVHQDLLYVFCAHETKDVAEPTCTTESGNPSATQYLLYAVGQDDQLNDVARNGDYCATLCMSSNGVKHPAVCWD